MTDGDSSNDAVPTGCDVPEVQGWLDEQLSQEQDLIEFVNSHKVALFNELFRCERWADFYLGVGAEHGSFYDATQFFPAPQPQQVPFITPTFSASGVLDMTQQLPMRDEAYTLPLSNFILLDEEEEVEIQPTAADGAPPKRFETMPGELPYGTVTLMIVNVPLRYGRQRLLEVWPPENCYNLLYVPLNSG
eukprot:CAMPEP_0117549206 /NCGR_PEP_ID=MMETSP0784-20121206/48045_1 /TAXON_ID=39447 /ORGANISM="" /LENGTH=189 /DNA_ID=CAMNT_0005346185 /DNA_START=10 /DNA_END=575 /DNA_ORIENTATION=-